MSETSPEGLRFPQSWVLVIAAPDKTTVCVYTPGIPLYYLPESFRRKVAQRLLTKMDEQEIHWNERERKYGRQHKDVPY